MPNQDRKPLPLHHQESLLRSLLALSGPVTPEQVAEVIQHHGGKVRQTGKAGTELHRMARDISDYSHDTAAFTRAQQMEQTMGLGHVLARQLSGPVDARRGYTVIQIRQWISRNVEAD